MFSAAILMFDPLVSLVAVSNAVKGAPIIISAFTRVPIKHCSVRTHYL